MDKNILFVCGSLNQTTMMHKIAGQLRRHNAFFTPFYADGLLGSLGARGWLDFTILGGRHRRSTEAYLAKEKLPVDFGGQSRAYDLIVTGTDLIVQKNLRGKRMVLVQEGMMEAEGLRYQLVRDLKLPRYLADTAATGLSDAYDLFCVASPGYRDLFVHKGVRPEKIRVTGIPNFDDARSYLVNDFPHWDYVMAATTCTRETFRWDDRAKFIRQVLKIANGRQIIFKLHPNENVERSQAEIRQYAPDALIYVDGNVNHMVANCSVLVTQFSSVVFAGLALGKEVYSYLDVEMLRKLTPIQNGGASAVRIAELCCQLLELPERERVKPAKPVIQRRRWEPSDI